MRFANQKIEELVNFIKTPVSEKVRSIGDPYYYGQSEKEWRDEQDRFHQYVQGTNRPIEDISAEVEKAWGLSPTEALRITKYSKRRNHDVSKHVDIGMPHALQSETLAKKALEASGNQTAFMHSNNPRATDLESMIGNLRQLVDVQNRYIKPGRPDNINIGVLQDLGSFTDRGIFVPNSSGIDAWGTAKNSRELQDIISDAKERTLDRGGDFTPDKLYQEKGIVDDDMVKDMLITSPYNVNRVLNRARRPGQGHYNATAPMGDLEGIDLNVLRDNIFGMTKGDLKDPRIGITPIRDKGKLKLNIPMHIARELGKPTSEVVSKEVNEVLRYLGNQ